MALVLILATVPADPPELLGKMKHEAIKETSGIVKSRRHPGIFWVHNDSGNPPALFAVTKKGKLVREYKVAAPNVDWEDITTDDDGHLYLGDIGNNGQRLPVRAIYQLDEPDPDKPDDAPLRPTISSFYKFPKTGRFDAEGLFLDEGKAVVVSKYRDGREAELFSVSLDPPGTLFKPVEPMKVGKLPGFIKPATGASLSADGLWLAVCSIEDVRVYHREPNKSWKPAGSAPCPDGQVEAITWDDRDLIIAGEDGRIHRIREADWQPGRGAKP